MSKPTTAVASAARRRRRLRSGAAALLISVGSATTDETTRPLKGKININPATRQQLIMLAGIDRSLSFKIEAHRKRRRVTKIEDSIKVQGIDRNLCARIKPFMVVEGKTTLRYLNR